MNIIYSESELACNKHIFSDIDGGCLFVFVKV